MARVGAATAALDAIMVSHCRRLKVIRFPRNAIVLESSMRFPTHDATGLEKIHSTILFCQKQIDLC